MLTLILNSEQATTFKAELEEAGLNCVDLGREVWFTVRDGGSKRVELATKLLRAFGTGILHSYSPHIIRSETKWFDQRVSDLIDLEFELGIN